MKSICIRPLLLTATISLATACATTPASTPIPTSSPDRKFVDLTPDERNAFNQTTQKALDAAMFSDESIVGSCTLSAAFELSYQTEDFASEDEMRAACATMRDACVSATKESRLEASSSSVANMNVPSDCSATAAEMEACLISQAELYHSIATHFTPCEALTTASLQSDYEQYSSAVAIPTPACQIVQDQCPAAFGTQE